ncbi:MAG: hypothetical protein M0R02_06040 [Bacteroidales bacterium]|nr:hypothetical protein [Bacteroidales bacterium]
MSSFALIVFIIIILTNLSDALYWTRTIIMIALIIPACILPIWLKGKLCPKPIEKKYNTLIHREEND